jgi:Ca2+-binding EF-hand superfamily protein
MMIRRLESVDKTIKPGSTIPIERITEAFKKMREGREGDSRDGDSGRDRSSDDDRGRSRGRIDESIEMEPLIPGFGIEQSAYTVPGFGPSAEIFSIPTSDADRQQAGEVLDRYDRNKDGRLDKEEIKGGRFWGNPLDFDRNSDGKLSAAELATRQATRRSREEAVRDERDDRDKDRRRDDKPDEPVKVDFEGRQSYRIYGETAPEGMPRFYSDRDLNRDGQISMSEFTSEWTDSRIAEFYAWDQNRDGVITLPEVQSGVNRGLIVNDAPTGVAPVSAMASNTSVAKRTAESTGDVASSANQPDEKMIAYAIKVIQRNDTNQDGVLTPNEWEEMLLSPADADLDGDGRVTPIEFASFWEAKRKNRR